MSVFFELTVCVAPKSFAHSSFRSSTSTAMIVFAPASRAPRIAASPTPPQPMTGTVSPRVAPAGFDRGPDARHDAPADQARGRGRDRRVDLRALTSRAQRLVRERADA